MHSVHSFWAAIEIKSPRTLSSGAEGDRFMLIEPPGGSNKHYVDVCAPSDRVSPCTIGAVWDPSAVKTPQDVRSKRVILHFCEGAYVVYHPREMPYGPGLRLMADKFNAVVFCLEYRLTTLEDSASPFPAQLLDAVTAYRYLSDKLEIDCSKIILAGDSAGGHLVPMFLRYILLITSTQFPLSVGVLLASPWVDFLRSPDLLGAEERKDPMDIIPGNLVEWDIRRFAEAMRNKGTDLRLYEGEPGPHDFLVSAKGSGYLAEWSDALDEVVDDVYKFLVVQNRNVWQA